MVTGILVPAGEANNARTIEVDDELATWQRICGGDVQMVMAGRLIFLMDEEVKLKNKPINVWATGYLFTIEPEWMKHDVLCGDILIVGDGGEGIVSVSDEVLSDWMLA